MFGRPRKYGMKPTDGGTAKFESGLWKVLGGAKKYTTGDATDELKTGNMQRFDRFAHFAHTFVQFA